MLKQENYKKKTHITVQSWENKKSKTLHSSLDNGALQVK